MSNRPPRHILAGDDSPDILELFRDILESEGHRVSLSSEALSLDQVKRVAPDLIILDHMIDEGEGSGWRLLEQLRRDPDTADLPVVVCTGAVHRVRENEALLDELDVRVVLKPFDIDRLIEAVNRAWSQQGEVPAPASGSAFLDTRSSDQGPAAD